MLLITGLRSILRCIFGRRKSCSLPPHVTLNSLIAAGKRKHLKGEINLVHSRGHDCIMLVFYFERFYGNHVRLLSKEYFYFRTKNWVVFSQQIRNQT